MLEQVLATKKAIEDLLVAVNTAKNVFSTLDSAIQVGQTIASYNVNPIVPGSIESTLRDILIDSITFRNAMKSKYPDFFVTDGIPGVQPPIVPQPPTEDPDPVQ